MGGVCVGGRRGVGRKNWKVGLSKTPAPGAGLLNSLGNRGAIYMF